MGVRILGPVRVTRDGGQPCKLSPKARALLAALVLATKQRASHDKVRECLWPHGGGSGASIRTLVKELRAQVPELLPAQNEPLWCALRVDRGDVDYFRFLDGRASARDQRGRERVNTLRTALDEWLGEPLEELGHANFDDERKRLTDEWRSATIDYLNGLLSIGESARFVSEMKDALRRWPDSEALCVVHMSAMGTNFRNITRCFNDWRRINGKPSDRLVKEYERLIQPRSATPSTVPRLLPRCRPDLVGRDAEVSALSRCLLPNGQPAGRIAVITGMPGSGKTQLAAYWAKTTERAFPGGTLYADLHGFASQDSPDPPAQVLAWLLSALAVRPEARKLDEMILAYRTALADREVLVVLDNARDVHQVRPLLPGSGPSVALVTSRDRLEELQARELAYEIRLGPLSHADAVAMLRADLGTARTGPDGDYLDEIATSCGDLPLALTVVAAKARLRPEEPLGEIAAALGSEATRLDSLSHRTMELNVHAALNSSYQSLSSEAAHLFKLLAIHPGPTIGWPAITALGGDSTRFATDELLAANLLEEPTCERFRYHDLVRLLAHEVANELPKRDRSAALDRVFGFLIEGAWACDQVLAPGRSVPVGPPSGQPVVAPRGIEDAMAWLDAEYATIATAIRYAHRCGCHQYTWLLAMIVVTYQWRSGRYSDAKECLGYAAQAAEWVAELGDQAMVYRMLAGSQRGLGDLGRAKDDLRQAITLSGRAGDVLGHAHGQHNLALLHRETGEPQAAARGFETALIAYRQLGDRLGEATTLSGLGKVWFDLGDCDGALRDAREALRVFKTTDDANGTASALVSLGRILAARHEAPQAIAVLSQAVADYEELRYPSREATAVVELADALCSANRFDEARTRLQLAAERLADIDQRAAAVVRARLASCDG